MSGVAFHVHTRIGRGRKIMEVCRRGLADNGHSFQPDLLLGSSGMAAIPCWYLGSYSLCFGDGVEHPKWW